MSFEERLQLWSLFEYNCVAEEVVAGYYIVHHLDEICSHPLIDWTAPNLFGLFRKHCPEATSELAVHSIAIAIAFTKGKRINAQPIFEAGYKMQYVVRGNVLADILWTTPKGQIRLEYKNDPIRRLK